MSKLLKKHWLSIFLALLSVAALFAAWAIAYKVEDNEIVVPSISATFKEFFALFGKATFWQSVFHTILRAIIAVAISFVLAAAVAALGAVYPPAKAFFAPIVSVFRVVPTMAITLILVLSFPRRWVPIVVTFLVVFPMLYAEFNAAIAGVDRELLNMAKAYKIPKRTSLCKIILPAVAPQIVSQLGTVISFALKLTISAEILVNLAKRLGLGGMMQYANICIEIPQLAALTLVSVILGLLVEFVFFIVDRFTFKWRCRDGN